MNAHVPPRLGRLLGDYERLTRNEGAALRAQDFSALAELFALKTALLAQIIKEGEDLGLDRRVVWFNDCLVALAAMARDNVNLAARSVVQLTAQRISLSAARHRLRDLGHAYGNVNSGVSRLFALS